MNVEDILGPALSLNAQFQKKSIPTQGRSLEIPRGRGSLKVKILEATYEARLEFPGRRDPKQKTFHGLSMDVFWNCTILSFCHFSLNKDFKTNKRFLFVYFFIEQLFLFDNKFWCLK